MDKERSRDDNGSGTFMGGFGNRPARRSGPTNLWLHYSENRSIALMVTPFVLLPAPPCRREQGIFSRSPPPPRFPFADPFPRATVPSCPTQGNHDGLRFPHNGSMFRGVFHTMETCFAKFSTQWKCVSPLFPHNGNLFSTPWKIPFLLTTNN